MAIPEQHQVRCSPQDPSECGTSRSFLLRPSVPCQYFFVHVIMNKSLTSNPVTLRYNSNCLKSVLPVIYTYHWSLFYLLEVDRPKESRKLDLGTYSDMRIPELKTSLARIVPNGLGTFEYAWIICSEVAWKSSSGPVVPAAT